MRRRSSFWDGRVEQLSDGTFHSPAGTALPGGFTNVLQIQAMFPVTGRDEMRGLAGDRDVENQPNELATIADTNFPGIWQGLMARLLGPEGGTNSNLPSYATLFAAAFPNVPQNQLGFQHAAMAIAAFEAETYLAIDTPWDNYVAGQNGALSTSAKRGALIFFGKGRCASCHSGNLFTDQEHHNILVPQLGPGKAPFQPDDVGRQDVTKLTTDRYKFRTPPLRNVAATGPYMHDGAFATLPAAVQHHLNPVASFLKYNPSQLNESALGSTVQNSLADLLAHWKTVDLKILLPTILSKTDQQDLLNFLNALTSPSLANLPDNVPDEVPSGLPVDGIQPMP
jgi:cytochrome c peroxidase